MIDLSTLTDEQLDELRVAILTEQERRQRLASTPNQSADLARAFEEAGGDVRHLPVVAQAQAEVRDVLWAAHPEFKPEFDTSVEDEATGLYPPYRQPAGAHDCYPLGDGVSEGGRNYVSLHPANVWPPSTPHPGLCREVPVKTPDPAPEEPPAEVEPEAEEFVQPTGAHDAYAIGDRVRFDGHTYRSLIAGNAHSPAAYPQGWEKED